MAKRMMAAWKVVAMVALVVLPGGSLVLLAMALRRAYRLRQGPFSASARAAFRQTLGAPRAWAARYVRHGLEPAVHRA